jgi:26S proteasome regulatory subunit N8
LKDVIALKLPINHEITQLLQDVFNLLPNLDVDSIVRAFTLQVLLCYSLQHVCA